MQILLRRKEWNEIGGVRRILHQMYPLFRVTHLQLTSFPDDLCSLCSILFTEAVKEGYSVIPSTDIDKSLWPQGFLSQRKLSLMECCVSLAVPLTFVSIWTLLLFIILHLHLEVLLLKPDNL